MRINKQELKRIFDAVGKAVNNDDGRLSFIEIECTGETYAARATDGYVALKINGKLEDYEINNYYLKPFKIDKKEYGYYEIFIENGRTVIKDENNLFTQKMPERDYPKIDALFNEVMNCYRVRLDAKLLVKMLTGKKTVKLYITEHSYKHIHVTIDDEVDGVIAPIKWER